jgi:beta-mannosidase
MADLLSGATWRAGRTGPDAAALPGDLVLDWLPATVPGTAAGVLRDAGLPFEDVDGSDWWWQTALPSPGTLELDGLATVAEVFVGDRLVRAGASMFVAVSVDVPAGTLSIVCRALTPRLRPRRPRPAWRSRLVDSQNIRYVRTSLLGRWALPDGVPAPVGPWRAVRLLDAPDPAGPAVPRSVALARSFQEGLSLVVDGRPVFVRGATWTPLDPVSLQNDPAALRVVLRRLQAGGLNLLRLPGVGAYEDEVFYDACDELGMLIWQDLAIARLEPPADDPDWRALLDLEVSQLRERIARHRCVVVVCGGDEVEQSAAMAGVTETPVLDALLADLRGLDWGGAVWVDNSPTGGVRPFSARPGTTHWFGVGGYRRPLVAATLADVGFASECLAFSIPPEGGVPPGGVPQDNGTDWDFADVTDHYVRSLFDREPTEDLRRAAVVEAMTAVLSAWRSPRHACAGAVILSARDVVPGSGWGLLDAAGRPKAPLLALPDVLAPTALLVEDRGLDGVLIHVVSDAPVAGELQVTVFDLDGNPCGDGSCRVEDGSSWDVEQLLDGFVDVNHAHRFGAPRYDVLHARLVAGGLLVAQATHLLRGPRRPTVDVGLRAVGRPGEVEITTTLAAQRVALDVPGFVPQVGWFHLAPGASRIVPVEGDGTPTGTVRALNGSGPIAF